MTPRSGGTAAGSGRLVSLLDATRDGIFFVSPAIVHPDPEQPRLEPDDELQASIAELGVLQAIIVRPHPERADEWLIVDGERRWKGAAAAKLKEIPVAIRIDLEDEADRLQVQLAANTGKPLPPLDEAKAWARLRELRGWSKLELAKVLGKPKSTVNDRLALVELPPFWLKLLEAGKLQASHAPVLHKFREFPEAAHQAALEELRDDYDWDDKKGAGEMEVGDFAWAIERAYLTHACPVSDLAAGYDGTVVELKLNYDGEPRKYAVEQEKWQPLREQKAQAQREREAKRRAEEPESDYMREGREQRKKEAAALKKKNALRAAQFGAVIAALPAGPLDDEWSMFVVRHLLEEMHNDTRRIACKLLGLEGKKSTGEYSTSWDYSGPIIQHAQMKLTVDARCALILQLLLAHDAEVSPYGTGPARRLNEAARILGIDLSAAKPAPAEKPAKGKKAKPAEPAPTAANVFSKVVRAQLNKSLIRKRVDQWPNDVVESMLRYATEQLPFWNGATHSNLLNDIAILTEAARVRGLPVPTLAEQGDPPPPKAGAIDTQEIKAAIEREAVDDEDEDLWDSTDEGDDDLLGDAHPATCIICGCTDDNACEEGCSWLVVSRTDEGGEGVCSQCAENATLAQQLFHQHTIAVLHANNKAGEAAEQIILAAKKRRRERAETVAS